MYKKILVPLDGSELAECVLGHVEIFIKECKVGNMVFLRVVQPTSIPFSPTEAAMEDLKRVRDLDEERRSKAGLYLKAITEKLDNKTTRIYTEAVIGSVSEMIVDYVENNGVDLIIMATHGRSGVSRWVRGSVADRVLRASTVPVLLVRAPGTKGAV